MRYCQTGLLDTFEFHDARLQRAVFTPERMQWRLGEANITTRNPLLTAAHDQQIDSLLLTFDDWEVSLLYRHGTYQEDAHGRLRPVTPAIPLPPQTLQSLAENGFAWEFQYGGPVKGQPPAHAFRFEFFGSNVDFYFLELRYRQVTAQWDGYVRDAWYTQ